MYECPKCCGRISGYEMKWANPDSYCPSCSKTLIFNFREVGEMVDLSDVSTDVLRDELTERETQARNITPDGIFVEFTCSFCGFIGQTDMANFDDDALFETDCEDCGEELIIDLV
jgi:hypothetical protein